MPDPHLLRWDFRLSRQLIATRIFTFKSKAIKRTAALLCLCFVLPISGLANTTPVVPPLLETARALQCAVDPTAAEAALTDLKKNTDAGTRTPNEWFGKNRQAVLHAGTLDIVTDVILDSIEKHPENTDLAESVLLGWNYCAVHHNGQYFDQSADEQHPLRLQATYQPPAKWRGLTRLGVSRHSTERYIPIAFSRTDQSTRPQVVYDWWAIQRNQCLPHPGTGELFFKKTLFGPSKIVAKRPKKNNVYPHSWSSDCSTPYTAEEHRIHQLRLTERETRIRHEAARTFNAAKMLEIQSNQQQVRMPIALANLQAHRLLKHFAALAQKRKATTEKRLRYMQASTHAKRVIITTLNNLERLKAREALQRRAEAFALRQQLEKENALKEAASVQQAELELQMAQQPTTQDTPVKLEPQLTPDETGPVLDIAQAEFKSPGRPPVITIISPPIGPPEPWTEPVAPDQSGDSPEVAIAKSITSTQTNTRATTPEVYYSEEPILASAIDWTEQKTGKNLQSTPPQSNSTSFPSGSVPPFVDEKVDFKDRKYHGFSGSFALSNRRFESISDAWSLTANFGYKPIRSSYFFARTGFTFIDTDSGEPVSYYWGIGYNDWHTDTWAFELNHWGPLKPGDGLQLEKVVASISYKFDSELLKNNGLSSSFSISGGENTAPTATLAGSWTPKPNWFIRTLITQPLEGGDTTWAYGFGYSDWREKTWALEYNNWGTNKAFDLNFRDNALVTLSWKWGF